MYGNVIFVENNWCFVRETVSSFFYYYYLAEIFDSDFCLISDKVSVYRKQKIAFGKVVLLLQTP